MKNQEPVQITEFSGGRGGGANALPSESSPSPSNGDPGHNPQIFQHIFRERKQVPPDVFCHKKAHTKKFQAVQLVTYGPYVVHYVFMMGSNRSSSGFTVSYGQSGWLRLKRDHVDTPYNVCSVYDALYCRTVQWQSTWKAISAVCHCQSMSQVRFTEPIKLRYIQSSTRLLSMHSRTNIDVKYFFVPGTQVPSYFLGSLDCVYLVYLIATPLLPSSH